jgi:hypothetical protein
MHGLLCLLVLLLLIVNIPVISLHKLSHSVKSYKGSSGWDLNQLIFRYLLLLAILPTLELRLGLAPCPP